MRRVPPQARAEPGRGACLIPGLPPEVGPAIPPPDRQQALAELLVHLPPGASVHLATPERVDAAPVAQMMLEVDRTLQPWHRDGLRAFVAAQGWPLDGPDAWAAIVGA